jgi:hypothetical protein
VRIRGWAYPHVESPERGTSGPDWVSQEFEWDNNLEFWRFDQSGQFDHLLAIGEDWRDQSEFWSKDDDWKPMKTLWEVDTLFEFTEIFEFAARLAQSKAGADAMRVEITLAGLKDRLLKSERTITMGDLNRYRPLECGLDCVQKFTLSQIQAMTEPRDLALEAAGHVFHHFYWDLSPPILRELQKVITRQS